MGHKRHPTIYGRWRFGRTEAQTRPLHSQLPRTWKAGFPACGSALIVYCSILNTRSSPASLERCIDPDSRGMTVSIALYTLESHPDPSRKTSNVQRKTSSKHSDRQTGDTSECFLFYLSTQKVMYRLSICINVCS